MDEARQERLAKNEALFRTVNETLHDKAQRRGVHMVMRNMADFVCECADVGCVEELSLSLDEYAGVREYGARFAIVPGHDVQGLERVVSSTERFCVVEKLGHAATIAERMAETDSRVAGELNDQLVRPDDSSAIDNDAYGE